MLKCVRKLCHCGVTICRAVISHLGHTQFHWSVRVAFPLRSEAVVGVATLGVPVLQTNTIQVFSVLWGTGKLPSIRSLFLTEHQSGLLENFFPLLKKMVEYIDVLFHLFLFSKPFFPACLLPFKQLMHRKQHPVLSEWLRGSAELLSRNLPWNHQLHSVLLLLSCWSSGKVPPQPTALHCPLKLPTPGLGPVGAAGGAPLGTTACFMCLGHRPWQRTECISLCWLRSEAHAQI